MRVKELIANLQNLDPESDVTIYCEDEGLKTINGQVQVFEVLSVFQAEAESNRLSDGAGKPWLTFGRTKDSKEFVLVEVTSDV